MFSYPLKKSVVNRDACSSAALFRACQTERVEASVLF